MMDAFLKRGKISRRGAADNSASGKGPKKNRPSKATSDLQPPPAKKIKRDENPEDAVEKPSSGYNSNRAQSAENGDTVDADPSDDDEPPAFRAPAIESALPEVKLDERTIKEYEVFKSSQGDEESNAAEGAKSRLDSRKWIRGKTSIYVDAFNLALHTVLEEESHLFDEKERLVFHQWGSLGYEAQFLYVRLFLRKTAQWHRIARLGYYNDISDTDAAVSELQKSRELPHIAARSPPVEELGAPKLSAALREQDGVIFNDTFVFADRSEDFIDSIEEAIALLTLDEVKALAKEAKVQGKNKSDLAKAICRTSYQQAGLMSLGLRRSNTSDSRGSPDKGTPELDSPSPAPADETNRSRHFFEKILAITGPCIRLSLPIFKLFERVHLVFYRSTEWTEKSLTTIILAKISKRNFPEYVVSRSANIFSSRDQLLEFETAMRAEYAVDNVLEFNGPPREADFRKIIDIFDGIYPRWKSLLQEEQLKEERVYETGEGAYLRRLNPAHPYTRIVHKAAYVFGRLKEHQREHALLIELLDQHLFHLARRGSWYQRKALLEEHYMYALESDPAYADVELQKKHWKRIAVTTCETALEDPNCHLIYHYDIQKRLVKLERQLKVPKRLQHDFGHVRLKQPEEHYVEGIQLKTDDIPTTKKGRGPSTKTIWVNEGAAEGGEGEEGEECSVEAMCLSWYRSQGWKGYHAEGGIIRTLFAYLFYDILFQYVPNVFQTAYQTCPLDLHTDAFYPARASAINHRLVEIANGGAAALIARVDSRERERRTCVVGLNWDYDLDDLLELAACFNGAALAAVCKVVAQEYGQRGGGIPDLVLWRAAPPDSAPDAAAAAAPEVMFAEVKSANDRLSDTQRLWIHVLTGAGVRVALCNAVAKEVRRV